MVFPPVMVDDRATSFIEAELNEEKAASYLRIVKRMEKAIHAYQAAVREISETGQPSKEQQRRLRTLRVNAGEATWFFLVQREAIKLRNHEGILDEYGVPGEVRPLIGPKPGK